MSHEKEAQSGYWLEVQRGYRFNGSLHVLQGALALFAMGVFSPATVLTPYVATMTSSKFLIGLPWVLSMFFWSFTSLFYSYFLRGLRQRKGATVFFGALSRTGFMMMALSALAAVKWGAAPALVIFFLAELVLAMTAGGAALAWQDMLGRIIPPARRAWFFGMREAAGQLSALVAAAFLFLHLRGRSLAAADYLFPLAVGAVVYWVSWAVFIATREPKWPFEAPARQPWSTYISETFGILRRHGNYRTFVLLRGATAAVGIFNLGLFAPYAIDRFGVSAAVVSGAFTAVMLAGRVTMALAAGRAAGRFGYKAVYNAGLAALTLVLGLGLALERLEGVAPAVLGLVYFLIGAQGTAIWMGTYNLQLEFGRVEDRPRYIALADTLCSPIVLAAGMASGLLVERFGYRPVMFVALLAAAAVMVASVGLLEEPRPAQDRSGRADDWD